MLNDSSSRCGSRHSAGCGRRANPSAPFGDIGERSLQISRRRRPPPRAYRGRQASNSALSRAFASTLAARRRWSAVGWAGLRRIGFGSAVASSAASRAIELARALVEVAARRSLDPVKAIAPFGDVEVDLDRTRFSTRPCRARAPCRPRRPCGQRNGPATGTGSWRSAW